MDPVRVVWAKFRNDFWPGCVLDREGWRVPSRSRLADSHAVLVLWFDSRPSVSLVAASNTLDFMSNFTRCTKGWSGRSVKFRASVQHAIRELRVANNLPPLSNGELVTWCAQPGAQVRAHFPLTCMSSSFVHQIEKLKRQNSSFKAGGTGTSAGNESDSADSSSEDEEQEDEEQIAERAERRRSGCLACGAQGRDRDRDLSPHPVFCGSICSDCKVKFLKYNYAIGELDGLNYRCVICWEMGFLIACSNKYCYRCYCDPCIRLLMGKDYCERVLKSEEWSCFLCADGPGSGPLKKRHDYADRMLALFGSDAKLMKELGGSTIVFGEGGSASVVAKILHKLKALTRPGKKCYLLPAKSMEDPSCLTSYEPIDLVLADVKGEDALTFFSLVSTMKILNDEILFLLAVDSPEAESYNKTLTRFFEVEPIWLYERLVYTNSTEIRQVLVKRCS